MSLLDDILSAPQKTKADYFNLKGKDYDDKKGIVNCNVCGKEFLGQAWMLKSNSNITCPSCWRTQKREDDDFE